MWLNRIFNLGRQILAIPIAIVRFFAWLVWKLLVWLVNFLIGVARPALRFIAFLSLLVATVAFVADATPALNGTGPFSPVAFEQHWAGLAPNSLEATRATFEGLPQGWLVTFLFETLIGLPTSFLFGLIGGLAAFVGRRQKQLNVFIN